MNSIRKIFNYKNPNIFGFNKANKFFFKKRMGLNHLDIQKKIKIDNDFESMTENNDWFDEGSEIQSHFYHEFLFNLISKKQSIPN